MLKSLVRKMWCRLNNRIMFAVIIVALFSEYALKGVSLTEIVEQIAVNEANSKSSDEVSQRLLLPIIASYGQRRQLEKSTVKPFSLLANLWRIRSTTQAPTQNSEIFLGTGFFSQNLVECNPASSTYKGEKYCTNLSQQHNQFITQEQTHTHSKIQFASGQNANRIMQAKTPNIDSIFQQFPGGHGQHDSKFNSPAITLTSSKKVTHTGPYDESNAGAILNHMQQ